MIKRTYCINTEHNLFRKITIKLPRKASVKHPFYFSDKTELGCFAHA